MNFVNYNYAKKVYTFPYSLPTFGLLVQEIEDPGEVLVGHNKVEDQSAATVIAILIDDVINREPRFLQERYCCF